MADADDLASRVNPHWCSTETEEEHWRYLSEIQRRLKQVFASL
jgi:hypothetical protein